MPDSTETSMGALPTLAAADAAFADYLLTTHAGSEYKATALSFKKRFQDYGTYAGNIDEAYEDAEYWIRYGQSSGTNATGTFPVSAGFFCLSVSAMVAPTTESKQSMQRLVQYSSGRTWYRFYINGAWSTWMEQARNATFDKLLAANDASVLASASNNTITPSEGSVSTSYGGCWYRKYGTRVHVHIAVTGMSSTSTIKIATLPAGYRASWMQAVGRQGGSFEPCYGYINASGEIYVRSTSGNAILDWDYDATA